METQYQLTYFNLRYLGEPIRMLFAYAGISFEDVRIDANHWVNIRGNFFWDKLPVLKTRNGELFQLHTILKYLASEFNLEGENNWESAKCHEYVDIMKDLLHIGMDSVSCILIDLMQEEWPKYILATNYRERENIRHRLMNFHFPNILGKMEQLTTNSGNKWIVGDKVTYADFYYANFMDIFEYYTNAGLPAKYPELNRIKQQIFALPQLQQHLQKRLADVKLF